MYGINTLSVMSCILVTLLTCFTISTLAQMPTGDQQSGGRDIRRNLKKENATIQALKQLLDGYDRRIRPYFATGQAVVIEVDFFLASFDSIRESHMDFGITLYLRQRWHDPRLEYDPSLDLPPTSHYVYDIWVPDLIITNAKDAVLPQITIPNRWIHINSSGHVLYNMRLNLQLSCAMDFHRFPMDYQSCEVDFESFENTIDEVVYIWHEDPVEYHLELLKLPQYEVDGVHTHNCSKQLKTGVYSCIGADFLFERTLGYYLLQTYIPSTLLVVTSWVSFWIQIKGSPARVALGVTTILTMITTNNGVRADLPKVSYIKAIDIWFAACFFFVIGALVEFAIAHYLSYSKASLSVLCKGGDHDEEKETKKKKAALRRFDVIASRSGVSRSILDDMDDMEYLGFFKTEGRNRECRSSQTNGVKMDSKTCMVITIEDTLDDETDDAETASDIYPASERRTPEADQDGNMGTYTNYGAQRKDVPTVSKRTNSQANNKKLCIKGQCRSRTKGGAPVYNAGKRIDRMSRILFPLSFVIFNFGYWLYYIKANGAPTHSFDELD